MIMRKTRPLLLYHFEIIPQKKYSKQVTPLFEMRAYPSYQYVITHQQNRRKKIGSARYNQSNQQIYDKYVCLHNKNASNARSKVLNNLRRQSILDIIDKFGKKNTLYTFQLSIINQFVPEQELINQIKISLTEKQSFQSTINHNSKTQFPLLQSLIPYNHELWKKQAKKRFEKVQVSSKQMHNSYIQIEIFNLYVLHFSKNKQALILDIIDFNKMLIKFNFINFFQKCSKNQYLTRKYCERFIKSLEWRCNQTQQYLLLLIRHFTCRKFHIAIKNFCMIYQQYQKYTTQIQK